MFSEVAKALMSGAFICGITMKEAYDYLENDEQFAEMDAYLSRIGMQVAQTRERSAFYATSIPATREEKADVKRKFMTIKNELRPVVQFLTMTASALGNDLVLAPGFMIPKAKFVDVVNDNPGLRSDLKTLVASMRGTGADGTTSALIDKVLRKMVEFGYLHLANREKEIYQITGKIDHFHEIVEFLVEHEQIPEIDGGEGQQDLLT